MDKLKPKVLFISLIILALLSISAVAAADDAGDEIISEPQNDFDLSEETVSDVQSAQETEVLTDDEPAQNSDGSSYVTVKFEYINETTNGQTVETIYKDKYQIRQNKNLSIAWTSTFSKFVPIPGQFEYDGTKYVLKNWTSSLTGEVVPKYKTQYLYATGYNYTVVYTADFGIYPNTVFTANWEMKDSNGEDKTVDGITVNEKCKNLAKKVKEIIDTKSSFADWLNNQIVRDQLKFDIKVCLIKNGYPPQYSPEVFRKVMEQVENFEENN